MPLIIACPACAGKLRVTDALFGQKVRCPKCHHTFDGPGEPATPQDAPRAPQDLPLDLSLDEPSSPPHFTPPGGLVGAIELTDSGVDPIPLTDPETPSEPRRRPRRVEKRLDFDGPDVRRRGPRRDAEPDRGSVVLALGIISLTGIMVWCIPIIGVILVPVCAILGVSAWIMGQTDLRKMKRGEMDESGRGSTQAGWICGIIGTILNGLLMVGCGVIVGSIFYSEVSRPPLTKRAVPMKPPPAPPPNPPAKKAIKLPPNNPPVKKF